MTDLQLHFQLTITLIYVHFRDWPSATIHDWPPATFMTDLQLYFQLTFTLIYVQSSATLMTDLQLVYFKSVLFTYHNLPFFVKSNASMKF